MSGPGRDMQKLFASDFDGTIHFWGSDEPVRRDDCEAIRAFQETGGLFGVCTGRPLVGLTKQVDGESDFGISFDFYITQTGATAFDRDRQPIFAHDVPREVVEELYARYGRFASTDEEGHSLALVVAADDYWTVGRRSAWEILNLVDSIDDITPPFGGYSMETVSHEDAAQFAAEINAEYGDVVQAFQNLSSIDVVAVGRSKGTALLEIATHYGAGLTGGIGDSYNDLPLLEAAGVGYTFHSSVEDLRASADMVIGSAAEALADFMCR